MHLICPQKFVFSFSLDGCIPGEMKNKGYAKFWGANKVHYGRCASEECSLILFITFKELKFSYKDTETVLNSISGLLIPINC